MMKDNTAKETSLLSLIVNVVSWALHKQNRYSHLILISKVNLNTTISAQSIYLHYDW